MADNSTIILAHDPAYHEDSVPSDHAMEEGINIWFIVVPVILLFIGVAVIFLVRRSLKSL